VTDNEAHRDKMTAIAHQLTRKLSGKPVACRGFVDLFHEDGRLVIPSRDLNQRSPLIVVGQRKIFQLCESYITESFKQTGIVFLKNICECLQTKRNIMNQLWPMIVVVVCRLVRHWISVCRRQ
jgi:hypothetical protein